MWNVIKEVGVKGRCGTFDVEDLIGVEYEHEHSAFMGRLTSHKEDKDELFLVCYSCVIQASDPRTTWDATASFDVQRFVDIENHSRQIRGSP